MIQNGVRLQHRESYQGPTLWRKLTGDPAKHPPTGPISLDFRGDPMEFGNIRVRPLGKRDQSN